MSPRVGINLQWVHTDINYSAAQKPLEGQIFTRVRKMLPDDVIEIFLFQSISLVGFWGVEIHRQRLKQKTFSESFLNTSFLFAFKFLTKSSVV